ncbi:hypothetical protein L9F63_018926 [Diploptera punctata]|uniref:C2H2-type domain-containing protein n=1 Tax=Diploptera punctata TaxID=6984 RepID=A0AAD7ZVU2_DIPPU|nr:hypothetical protein L9F63_018926 [Diploptera punctata]
MKTLKIVAMRSSNKSVSSTTLSPAHSSEDSRDEVPSTSSTSSLNSNKSTNNLEQSRERLKKLMGQHLFSSERKTSESSGSSLESQYQRDSPWQKQSDGHFYSDKYSSDPRLREDHRKTESSDVHFKDKRVQYFNDGWNEDRSHMNSGNRDEMYMGWTDCKRSSRRTWHGEEDRYTNMEPNFGSNSNKPIIGQNFGPKANKPMLSPTSMSPNFGPNANIPLMSPPLLSPRTVDKPVLSPTPNLGQNSSNSMLSPASMISMSSIQHLPKNCSEHQPFGVSNSSPLKRQGSQTIPALCNVLQHPPLGSKPLSDADIEELMEDTSNEKPVRDTANKDKSPVKSLRAKLEQEIQQVHKVGVSKGGALRNLMQKDDKLKSPPSGRLDLIKPSVEMRKDKPPASVKISLGKHKTIPVEETESRDSNDAKPTDPRKRVPYSPRGEEDCRSVNWDLSSIDKRVSNIKPSVTKCEGSNSNAEVSQDKTKKDDGNSILSGLSKEQLQKIVEENLRNLPSPPPNTKEILETVNMGIPSVPIKQTWLSSPDIMSPLSPKEYNHGLTRNPSSFNSNLSNTRPPLLPNPDLPHDPRSFSRNQNQDPRLGPKESHIHPPVIDPRLNSSRHQPQESYRLPSQDPVGRHSFNLGTQSSFFPNQPPQQWAGTPCYGVLSQCPPQRHLDEGFRYPSDSFSHHSQNFQGHSTSQHDVSQFQGQMHSSLDAFPTNHQQVSQWQTQHPLRGGPPGNFHSSQSAHFVERTHGLNKVPVDPRLSGASNFGDPRLTNSAPMNSKFTGHRPTVPNTGAVQNLNPSGNKLHIRGPGPPIRSQSIEGRSGNISSERDPRRKSIEELEKQDSGVRGSRDKNSRESNDKEKRRNFSSWSANSGRTADRWKDRRKHPGPRRYEPNSDSKRSKSPESKKEKETDLVSPLNSLYGVAIIPKTGKGYGVQKFRIPKIKRPSPPPPPPPPLPVPPVNSKLESQSNAETEDNAKEVSKTESDVDVKGSKITAGDSVGSKSGNLSVFDSETDKNSESRSKGSLTEEWIEGLIRKSFESGEGKKFMEKAKLLEKLGESLKGKKLRKIKQILESDSESDESVSETSKKKDKSESEDKLKYDFDDDSIPTERSRKTKSRRIIESDDEHSTDSEPLAIKLQKRVSTSEKDKLSDKDDKKFDELSDSCANEETECKNDEESALTEEQGKPVKKYAKRRSALELLQEDIRDMFICEGVVTATGHRMCRLLKETRPDMTKDVDDELSIAAEDSDGSSVLGKKLDKKTKDKDPTKKGKEGKQKKKQTTKLKLKGELSESGTENVTESHSGRDEQLNNDEKDAGEDSSSPITKPRKKCGKSKRKGYVIEESDDSEDESTTHKVKVEVEESELGSIPSFSSTNRSRKAKFELKFSSDEYEGKDSEKHARVPRVLLEKADISKLNTMTSKSKYFEVSSSDESTERSSTSPVNISKSRQFQKSRRGRQTAFRGRGKRSGARRAQKKRSKSEASTDRESVMSGHSSAAGSIPPNTDWSSPYIMSGFTFRRKGIRKRSKFLGKKIDVIIDKLTKSSDDTVCSSAETIILDSKKNLENANICKIKEDKDSKVNTTSESDFVDYKTGDERKLSKEEANDQILLNNIKKSSVQKKSKKRKTRWQLGIINQYLNCEKNEDKNELLKEENTVSEKDDHFEERVKELDENVEFEDDVLQTESQSVSLDKGKEGMVRTTLSDSFIDKMYVLDGSAKYLCKLCPGQYKNIVVHYKNNHSKSEVLISRLSEEQASQAIAEAMENDFEKKKLKKENVEKHIRKRHSLEDQVKVICINMSDSKLRNECSETENLEESKDTESAAELNFPNVEESDISKEMSKILNPELISEESTDNEDSKDQSEEINSNESDKNAKMVNEFVENKMDDHIIPMEIENEKTEDSRKEFRSEVQHEDNDSDENKHDMNEKNDEIMEAESDMSNSVIVKDSTTDVGTKKDEMSDVKNAEINENTTVESEPAVVEPPKEIDLKAFVCSDDFEEKNSVIQKERLKKMEEIAKDLKDTHPKLLRPNRSSILDQLSDKLKTNKPDMEKLEALPLSALDNTANEESKNENVTDVTTLIDEKRAIEAAKAVQNLLRAEKQISLDETTVDNEDDCTASKNIKFTKSPTDGVHRRITRSFSKNEDEGDGESEDESSSDISLDFDVDDNEDTPESESSSPDILITETLTTLKDVNSGKSSNRMHNIIERLVSKVVTKTEPVDETETNQTNSSVQLQPDTRSVENIINIQSILPSEGQTNASIQLQPGTRSVENTINVKSALPSEGVQAAQDTVHEEPKFNEPTEQSMMDEKTDENNFKPSETSKAIGKPPPLMSIVEFKEQNLLKSVVINDITTTSAAIQVGPLEVKRFSEGLLYLCCVYECIFTSTDRLLYAMHINNAHASTYWNGDCNVCGIEKSERVKHKLSIALDHLIICHLVGTPNDVSSNKESDTKSGSSENKSESVSQKTPESEVQTPVESSAPRKFIRLRRLSGDLLSVPKPSEPPAKDVQNPTADMEESVLVNVAPPMETTQIEPGIEGKEETTSNEEESCSFLRIESVVSLNPEAMGTDNVHDILSAVEEDKSPEKSESMETSSDSTLTTSRKSIFTMFPSSSSASTKSVDTIVPIMSSSPKSYLKSMYRDPQLMVTRKVMRPHTSLQMIPVTPLSKASSITLLPGQQLSPVKLSQLSPVKLHNLKNIDLGHKSNIPHSLVGLSKITRPGSSSGGNVVLNKDRVGGGLWKGQVVPPILPKTTTFVRVEIKDNKVTTKQVQLGNNPPSSLLLPTNTTLNNLPMATKALQPIPIAKESVSSIMQIQNPSASTDTQVEKVSTPPNISIPTTLSSSSVPSPTPALAPISPTRGSISKKKTVAPVQSTPASILPKPVLKNKIPHKPAVAPSYAKASKLPAVYQEMIKPGKLRHLYKCMARYCSYSTDNEADYSLHYDEHEQLYGLNGTMEKRKKKTATTLKLSEWQQCAYCCAMHTSLSDLLEHIRMEHGYCLYQCAYCFYRAISKSYVVLHQNTSHINEHVAVLKCREANLPPLQEAVIPRNFVVEPYVCGQGLDSIKFLFSAYTENMIEVFKSLRQEHSQITIYSCHICANKSFKPERLLAENGNAQEVLESLKILDLDEEMSDPTTVISDQVNTITPVDKDRIALLDSNHDPFIRMRADKNSDSTQQEEDESTSKKNYDDVVVLDDDDDDIPEVARIVRKKQSGNKRVPQSQSQAKSDSSYSDKENSNDITEINILSSDKDSDIECLGETNNSKKVDSKLNKSHDSDIIILESTPSTTSSSQSDDVSKKTENENKEVSNSENTDTKSGIIFGEPIVTLKHRNPKTFEEIKSAVDPLSSTDQSSENSNICDQNASQRNVESNELILNEPLVTLKHRDPKKHAEIQMAVDPLSLDDIGNAEKESVNDNSETKSELKQGELSSSAVEDEEEDAGLTGSLLYRCGNVSCTFSAENSSLLKDHLLVCDLARDSASLSCVHCKKQFKHVSSLLEHFRIHGTKRYSCGSCTFKAPVPQQVVKHLKQRHKVNSTKVVPLNPLKSDPETAMFIIFPKDKGKGKGGKSYNKDAQEMRNKCSFLPEEIELLPRQAYIRDLYSVLLALT